jgi:hypothetical protein
VIYRQLFLVSKIPDIRWAGDQQSGMRVVPVPSRGCARASDARRQRGLLTARALAWTATRPETAGCSAEDYRGCDVQARECACHVIIGGALSRGWRIAVVCTPHVAQPSPLITSTIALASIFKDDLHSNLHSNICL